jgi:hypothetical protein
LYRLRLYLVQIKDMKQYRTKTWFAPNTETVTRKEYEGVKYRMVTREKNSGRIVSASKWTIDK